MEGYGRLHNVTSYLDQMDTDRTLHPTKAEYVHILFKYSGTSEILLTQFQTTALK